MHFVFIIPLPLPLYTPSRNFPPNIWLFHRNCVSLQAETKIHRIMTTIALNGLWAYIQTLNLSKRNRKWLAEKLMGCDDKAVDDTEYINSSPAMLDVIEKGRKEIAEGNVETIAVDDLWK